MNVPLVERKIIRLFNLFSANCDYKRDTQLLFYGYQIVILEVVLFSTEQNIQFLDFIEDPEDISSFRLRVNELVLQILNLENGKKLKIDLLARIDQSLRSASYRLQEKGI